MTNSLGSLIGKLEALRPKADAPELSERAYRQAVDDCIAIIKQRENFYSDDWDETSPHRAARKVGSCEIRFIKEGDVPVDLLELVAVMVDVEKCAFAIEDLFEKAKDDPTAGIHETDIVKAVLYAAGVPYGE